MAGVSAVIPTFERGRVLVDTVKALLNLDVPPSEILVVDQTRTHEPATAHTLQVFNNAGKIRWVKLPRPSITHAMNIGLQLSANEIVLFLDDDIVPGNWLVKAHLDAQARGDSNIVAGQVLQPGELPIDLEPIGEGLRFCSNRSGFISEVMGGNFSVKRSLAIRLGGFDENFVQAAYRFEAEFVERALAVGEMIFFEPQATIRHLRAGEGGTRSFGNHLRTIRPGHSVGEYYYLLRSRDAPSCFLKMLKRPLRAISTRHHLKHPWWIPATLIAEALGFGWALLLGLHGPRLITRPK